MKHWTRSPQPHFKPHRLALDEAWWTKKLEFITYPHGKHHLRARGINLLTGARGKGGEDAARQRTGGGIAGNHNSRSTTYIVEAEMKGGSGG
jgi:hypothetical protein